jgi:hypothetical protein
MFLRLLGILFAFWFSSAAYADKPVCKLQSTINLTPKRPPVAQPDKIIPSTKVMVSVMVKNVGDLTNSAGDIYVRFSLRPPHQNDPSSVIFETEKVKLPAIAPGEETEITFDTNQLLPTVFDFVRYDWAMREYEAIIEVDGKQAITGTRALAFTAYYYEGASESKPTQF